LLEIEGQNPLDKGYSIPSATPRLTPPAITVQRQGWGIAVFVEGAKCRAVVAPTLFDHHSQFFRQIDYVYVPLEFFNVNHVVTLSPLTDLVFLVFLVLVPK